jgi:hypothetical protein
LDEYLILLLLLQTEDLVLMVLVSIWKLDTLMDHLFLLKHLNMLPQTRVIYLELLYLDIKDLVLILFELLVLWGEFFDVEA